MLYCSVVKVGGFGGDVVLVDWSCSEVVVGMWCGGFVVVDDVVVDGVVSGVM